MKKKYFLLVLLLGIMSFQFKCIAQTITGETYVCLPSESKEYTTEGEMSNYNWIISEGGSIIEGQGTNTIEVVWEEEGNHTVSVSYTHPENGNMGPVDYLVTVNTLTEIITQPQAPSGMIQIGQNITMSVEALGGNLSYRWQKDGVDIPGAMAQTYEITSARDEDNGIYRVIVSGACEKDTSRQVSIKVGNIIYIEEPGTLRDSLRGMGNLTSLSIVGKINARDIRCLRDEYRTIGELDLSEAKMVAYKGRDGTYYGSEVEYKENEFPGQAFFRGFPTIEGSRYLKKIILPDSLVAIGHNAFEGCKRLATVENMTEDLSIINDRAFANCDSLTSITLPKNLKIIGGGSFANCRTLPSISFPDSLQIIGDFAFSYCLGFTKVELPESVDSLGTSAFEKCEKLEQLELPVNLRKSARTFYGCTALKEVINNSYTPQIITDSVFGNLEKSSCTLRVPETSVALYKNAAVWKEFNVVGMNTPVGIEDVSKELSVKIYPNPTKGIIHIEAENNKVLQKSVYDTNGRLLLETKDASINLSTYPNGLYLIYMENKVYKIIKR